MQRKGAIFMPQAYRGVVPASRCQDGEDEDLLGHLHAEKESHEGGGEEDDEHGPCKALLRGRLVLLSASVLGGVDEEAEDAGQKRARQPDETDDQEGISHVT